MENREKDRFDKRDTGTGAGEQNRRTEEVPGREQNSGTSASFDQKIGRSEELSEGGSMKDRNKEGIQSDRNENEPNKRPESGGFGSATGKTGSIGNRGGGGSDVSRDEMNDMDRDRDSSRDRKDPSEGRH